MADVNSCISLDVPCDIHAPKVVRDDLQIEIERQADCLLISVHDPGLSEHAAEPERSGRSGRGGWGLQIVERLSMRWGTERPDGYRVWAELAAVSY
jgi:hypothetical protein